MRLDSEYFKCRIDSYSIYCYSTVPRESDDIKDGYRKFIVLVRFPKQTKRNMAEKIYKGGDWTLTLPERYDWALGKLSEQDHVPILTKPGRFKYDKTSEYSAQKIKEVITLGKEVMHSNNSIDRYKVLFDHTLMANAKFEFVRLVVMGDEMKENVTYEMEVGKFINAINGKVKYVIKLPNIPDLPVSTIWFPSIDLEAGKVIYELCL